MKAVFRHELSGWFSSVTTYVLGAFLLLFGGIYTMVICLQSQVGNFEYVFANMTIIFLFVIPIATMKIIAEEKRQKTDQLLYSMPISMTEVVMGKYLAMLIVFIIPIAIILAYPVALSAYGDVYLPAAFSAGLGYFLLGAALLAIGMFVSSISEAQPTAAGLCFVVMLLNYYLTSLTSYVPEDAYASLLAFAVLGLLFALIVRLMTKSSFAATVTAVVLEGALVLLYIFSQDSFTGLFSKVMGELSLFEQFYQFVYGIFDLSSVVYLLSVCAVIIFLSVQSMEKRRWSE